MKPKAPSHSSGSAAAAASPQTSGSAAAELSPARFRLGQRRLHLFAQFDRLVDGGMTKLAAASEVGHAYSWVWKLQRRLTEGGPDALIPKPGKGGKPILDPALFTPPVVSDLQKLAVQMGSAKAVGLAYTKSRGCPAPLRRYIIARGGLPEELRQLIGLHRVKRAVRVAGNFVHVEGAGTDQRAA